MKKVTVSAWGGGYFQPFLILFGQSVIPFWNQRTSGYADRDRAESLQSTLKVPSKTHHGLFSSLGV